MDIYPLSAVSLELFSCPVHISWSEECNLSRGMDVFHNEMEIWDFISSRGKLPSYSILKYLTAISIASNL
jgi:hypothetical protein